MVRQTVADVAVTAPTTNGENQNTQIRSLGLKNFDVHFRVLERSFLMVSLSTPMITEAVLPARLADFCIIKYVQRSIF